MLPVLSERDANHYIIEVSRPAGKGAANTGDAQTERRRLNPAAAFSGTRMTGEESRKLKSGDCVFWRDDLKNQGSVRGTSWSGVTIDWDDGESTSVSHNDMAQVSRAPS
jgi:hypothetical protein